MRDLILSFPQQLTDGQALGAAQQIQRRYHRIISCGMGGSSVAGELLSLVRDDVVVHWDYDLPKNTGTDDLVICTSWSGTTEETISSCERACELGIDTLVITGGGKLAEIAHQHGSPLVALPQTNTISRANVGYMAGALFAALDMQKELPSSLDPKALESAGKEFAEKIGNRIPVIYASYPWRKATGFWKMAYSETAKRQVMTNWFPSGAHTEIVGWEGPYTDVVAFLLLRDGNEQDRYAKNFDALLALVPKKGYTVHVVPFSGSTVLEKAINSYLMALWTGYYAALHLGVDPTATELLDEFKQLKI